MEPSATIGHYAGGRYISVIEIRFILNDLVKSGKFL